MSIDGWSDSNYVHIGMPVLGIPHTLVAWTRADTINSTNNNVGALQRDSDSGHVSGLEFRNGVFRFRFGDGAAIRLTGTLAAVVNQWSFGAGRARAANAHDLITVLDNGQSQKLTNTTSKATAGLDRFYVGQKIGDVGGTLCTHAFVAAWSVDLSDEEIYEMGVQRVHPLMIRSDALIDCFDMLHGGYTGLYGQIAGQSIIVETSGTFSDQDHTAANRPQDPDVHPWPQEIAVPAFLAAAAPPPAGPPPGSLALLGVGR